MAGGLPGWLAGLLIGAALFRLVMGVIWTVTLPQLGHGSKEEQAGYVMADAYVRDQAAWELGESDKPLLKAFQGYRKADQYGGLLFLSAVIYRFLGGTVHIPLEMVLIGAAFSALAVIFTWALAKRAWDEKVATLAAWGLALYPEAVLLGSSQMREAFVITCVAMAFYGVISYCRLHHPRLLFWVLAAILICVPISPPLAGLLLGAVFLTWLLVSGSESAGRKLPARTWVIILLLIIIILLAGLWIAWKEYAPEGITNPVELVSWWIRKSADFQAYLNTRASGWMQKIFHSTPDFVHLPILIGYGIVRPFLPAAFIASSEALIWPWITIWRAIGWSILLILLIYAPLRAWSSTERNRLAQALSIVIWLGILTASFRGGGDQDDNPRYRAVFASIQIALAAWAWVSYRRTGDVWFRRALVSMALILFWFIPWYMRRYTPLVWPVIDLFKTLGLGVISSILYILWDWTRTARGVSPPSNGGKSP